jgi:hypothetical protein
MKIVNDFIGDSWIKGPSTLIEIGTFVFFCNMCMLFLRGGWHIEQLWGNAGIYARPSTNADEQAGGILTHVLLLIEVSLCYSRWFIISIGWEVSNQRCVLKKVHIFLLHAYLLRCCLLSVGKKSLNQIAYLPDWNTSLPIRILNLLSFALPYQILVHSLKETKFCDVTIM